MSEVNKNLGHATAYGYAKSKGYAGTEEEFAELMADYPEVARRAEDAADAAEAAARAAEMYADDAGQSATDAEAAQTAAAQSASAASGSASQAALSASNAASSATSAQTSATNAEQSKTDAETAQGKAEDAQTAAETAETNAAGSATQAAASAASVAASAAQIATNTADITELKSQIDKNISNLIGVEVPLFNNPFGLKLYDCGNGKYNVNKRYNDFYADAVKNIEWKTYYVNPLTGNNANSGTSPENALSSVAVAVDKTGNNIRVVLPSGKYDAFNNGLMTISNKSKNICIECVDGTYEQRFGIKASTRTWSNSGSVWQNTISKPVSVSLASEEYTEKTTLSECQNVEKTWYYGNGILYIHARNGVTPYDEFLEFANTLTIAEQTNTSVLVMRNIKTTNGAGTKPNNEINFAWNSGATTSADIYIENVSCKRLVFNGNTNLFAKGCTVQESPTDSKDAIVITNHGKTWFENCVIPSAGADGFNYHNVALTGSPVSVELECVVKNAGTSNNATINNCSTLHENWKAIRIGGGYYKSRDRVIHDIHTSKSINAFLSVVQEKRDSNTTMDFACGNEASDSSEMYIYKCNVDGSRSTYNIGIFGGTNTKIKLFGTRIDRAMETQQIDFDWNPFAD